MFYGSSQAAHHNDRAYAMFMHVPGLKIVVPSSPVNAKGLMRAAIRSNDPVLVFEDSTLWGTRGDVPVDPDFIIPLGEAEIRQRGSDVTVIGIGQSLRTVDQALKLLGKDGISIEVIDPRSLCPFDWKTVLASVDKTRRVVVVDNGPMTCGVAGEILATVAEHFHGRLLEERGSLLLLAAILAARPLVVGLATLLKHQALAANFPMRLRWNFHRLLLGQSMSFYQDEFAGRIATKVMQTALAVRDTWMVLADIVVFVVIYFATMAAVVGGFNPWILVPFLGWLTFYVAALVYFVPRLGRVAAEQADARSLMTGRITDAYTNIATVKLFSHAQREAGIARSAMQEFMQTAYAQMRLVSGFEVANHVLSMALIACTAGVTLWLWTKGEVGIGAVAAATGRGARSPRPPSRRAVADPDPNAPAGTSSASVASADRTRRAS